MLGHLKTACELAEDRRSGEVEQLQKGESSRARET